MVEKSCCSSHTHSSPWVAPCRGCFAPLALGPKKTGLTIISGVGWTLWQVILGRGISGLGGAGMISLVSIYITGIVLPHLADLSRLTCFM